MKSSSADGAVTAAEAQAVESTVEPGPVDESTRAVEAGVGDADDAGNADHADDAGDAGDAGDADHADDAGDADDADHAGDAGAPPAEAATEAATEPPAEAAGQTAGPGPGRPWRRWVAAAVLAVLLAVSGYEGWLLFDRHQRDAAAAQALAAAEKYTLALTSVDPNAIDKNFAEVLDGATGEFKRMYTESSEQLRQLLIENKAAAHGTVIDAAVKSATKTRVEVVLFVDQSVSNKAAPGPQIDRSRILMTMEKVDGRWLAAKVDMP
jgi:Mce-associated membrane protein